MYASEWRLCISSHEIKVSKMLESYLLYVCMLYIRYMYFPAFKLHFMSCGVLVHVL